MKGVYQLLMKGGDEYPQVDRVLYASLALLLVNVLVYNGIDIRPSISSVSKADNYMVSEVRTANLADMIKTIPGEPQKNRVRTLSLPVKSMKDITSWTSLIAVQLFSVDFFRFNQQINALKPFFTDDGWAAMNEALDSSGWKQSIVNTKLSSTAVLSSPPIVTKHGVMNGAYTWVISFPLLVTYESASEKRQETRSCILTVRRIPTDFKKDQAGIAIDSFKTTKGGMMS
mgnify:CR=1 FL=1